MVVAVEDIIVQQLSISHGGHALAREGGLAIDTNEVSGLCPEGALDHLLH